MTGKLEIDYSAVVTDLEKRIYELKQAVAAIKKIMYQENSGNASLVGKPAIPTVAVAIGFDPNAFHGLTIKAAAIKYLKIVGKPQKSRKIAEALENGGYQHESKNFVSTVTTVLFRKSKSNGPFVKLNDGWGLPEWKSNVAKGNYN